MPFSKEDVLETRSADLPSLLPESCKVRKTRENTWACNCWLPEHEDTRASVAIWRFEDGAYRYKCYGCGAKGSPVDAVMSAYDLSFPAACERILGRSGNRDTRENVDLGNEVDIYDYVAPDGSIAYSIKRYEPKAFRPWHVEGEDTLKMGYGTKERFLYNGESFELWREKGQTRVYLVEGEKDAESVTAADCAATTWAGGADAWRDALADQLKGWSEVVLIPDRDEPGHNAMRAASLACMDRGIKVGYILLQNAKDISDWLEMGLPLSDLESDIVWDTPVPPYESDRDNGQ